jgi:biopolymer transport protein ExbD
MRRFSQRNSLVTLSDINITPLLDLAFVLLIIFVITTPLLTQSINLRLPKGIGQPNKPLEPKDVRTIEITAKGEYRYDRKSLSPDQIEAALVKTFQSNPNLVVYIRADENGPYKNVAVILDRCVRRGITRIALQTEPVAK